MGYDRVSELLESRAITRGLHHKVDMAVCEVLGCAGIAKYQPEISVYHDFEAEMSMRGDRASTHADALRIVEHMRGGKPYASPLDYLRFVEQDGDRAVWQVSSAFGPAKWGGTGDDAAV